MNLQHLQYIVEIYKCGSISKAAQKLFVSQPYLSKILLKIENDLQITIFSRSKDGVTLTYSGKSFIQYAERLLNTVENLNNIYKETYKKTERLFISSVHSSYVIDSYIHMLNKIDFESLEFNYKECEESKVIQDVYSGIADVGVVYTSSQNASFMANMMKNRNLSYIPVCKLKPQIIISKNHPILKNNDNIQLEDLYKYGLVLYDTSEREFMKNISFYKIIDKSKINKVIYVYDRAVLHNILNFTDYFGLGAQSTLRQEEMFNLVSISINISLYQQDIFSELWVFYPSNKALSSTAKLFIDTLIDDYGD